MSSRAVGLTTQEMSMIFWVISFVLVIVSINYLLDLYSQIAPINQSIAGLLLFIFLILIISKVFDFMSMFMPNYKISKENLTLLIDKITNPDYIGWIRFTRNKKLRLSIVKCGPLGQTKGMAYDNKADVINTGDYTVTTSNGNQAIIVSDLLSTNINMNEILGLNLLKKHFGIIGFDAYQHCAEEHKLLFKEQEKPETLEETKKPEEVWTDGEI